jgi:hypothetical protein
MSMASPEIQNLVWRLLAAAAVRDKASKVSADVALQVIAELRLRLVRLAGIEGFRSLLVRALALAKAEVSLLTSLQISGDGSLIGFDEIEQDQGAETAAQAAGLLIAHLLELLVAFIGESLTLGLLRDAWPDAFMEREDLSSEGRP